VCAVTNVRGAFMLSLLVLGTFFVTAALEQSVLSGTCVVCFLGSR